MHEAIFVILYILEFGINENFKDSTVYADEYMKIKSNHDDALEFQKVKTQFEKFNKFLFSISADIEYPLSKEIYGVESRNYKFQMSIAMIIAAIFKKEYDVETGVEVDKNEVLDKLKDKLLNSFLEDTSYKASTTNSKKINELVRNY